jgi:hypothetical protein
MMFGRRELTDIFLKRFHNIDTAGIMKDGWGFSQDPAVIRKLFRSDRDAQIGWLPRTGDPVNKSRIKELVLVPIRAEVEIKEFISHIKVGVPRSA